MEFVLFGEVQLRVAGRPLDIGTPRQQAVLAVVAAEAGRPVSLETIINRVWGDDSPPEARNVLYSHISRIRRLFKEIADSSGEIAELPRRTAGYVLEIDPDDVDLLRFERLVDRGNDPLLSDADRVAALAEAVFGRPGAPLAGIQGDWADQVRATWHRRRLDAAVRWGELELRRAHPDAVIDVLSGLAGEYPLAEPLEALLMRALHAAGRPAEALDRYDVVRKRLAEALGTDPGPELRALHRAMLRDELPAAPRSAPVTTPAQLPPGTPGFVGRETALRHLDWVSDEQFPATRVVVLSGTAGVGKTALAVHWAHTVAAGFPDGQLYVNLRGFDPTGSPVDPAEALRGFLEALDVPGGRLPTTLEAQAGRYRSLLAQRRVLIVLDNARDAEQVRLLLPGAPGSVVVVTSRDRLAGLVVAGAHPLTVDLLDDAEARVMLRRRIGAGRVAAEPEAVDEIIGLCARLPLALAVAAARAATHPAFSLAALAGQLRDARDVLDELSGTDPATDARAVFSWSYLRLDPAAARLFRLFGLHSGPDVGTRAAASLAGVAAGKARQILSELAHAHLITEHAPGRYTVHDLLRAYATELVQETESAAEREEAAHRVLGHYAHTAYHADGFLDPRLEVPPELTPLPAGAESERITDRRQAVAWFEAEHRVLLLAVHAGAAFDTRAWDLARSMQRFLSMQGLWHDERDVLTVAAAAARRLGDERKQAFAHLHLAGTHVRFGRHTEAHDDLRTALTLSRAAGDVVGQAYAHRQFAWLLDRQGAVTDALAHAEQALELFRAAEHRAGQATALNAVGWFRTLLGEHEVAIGFCQQALDLQTQLADQMGAAQSWHSIGYAHKQLGDPGRALTCYETGLNLAHRNGNLMTEARLHIEIANLHQELGDVDAARSGRQRAHDILAHLAHPDADEVRTRLSEVNSD
ncbi:BTAD domain-containing putative transcriptional regulator [Amycolatopsis sp., V23-08]|uniref:BTAD domain-containing putative transcriptional regulator n=1 Tax=Amycolatopsis heterodermiae TaxID=3110235 RepID=A0ABU5R2V2_9PSEU|nr:BTAD domain-containing putative transcriptional regulator [Amycolatopsis sp., V23-08]MEA5360533.1 BTAD domain-containing putative transcriptional regulator [Amycolatopsis sp., V23-08]